jgi:diadenosine tetraphosphatase ApaH/serine/threonine PP2A family protein phosphatase
MTARVAVVSDLHGNLVALEAVLADLGQTSPDLVLQGGDVAVAGPRPAEVLDRVRELGWPGVLGNTDEVLWRPELEAEVVAGAPTLGPWMRTMFGKLAPWAAERLGEERLAWLRSQPLERSDAGLRLVHASPGSLWRAPMPDADPAELKRTYAPLGGELAVYGHIHRPFVAETDSVTVANAGSGGFSWDGDPRAAYLLVTDGRAEVRRVAYDVEAAARDARDASFPFPEWLGGVYASGTFTRPED